MEQGTAIILAGGKSSRMGEDKGLMLIDGKSMIEYILKTVSQFTNQIIIIANDEAYEKFGYPIYKDLVYDKGPIAGIVTGLKNSKTDKNWILSCDSPFIEVKLLQKLMIESKGFDAVVSVHNNKIHPLIAVYSQSALIRFQENLALNRLKILDTLDALKVNYLELDNFNQSNFKNLNSKSDL